MGDWQAQIKVSKCRGDAEISGHMLRCRDEAQASVCSQFITTIIIQDVYTHITAISRRVFSLKEYIVFYTSALAEHFNTLFVQPSIRLQHSSGSSLCPDNYYL